MTPKRIQRQRTKGWHMPESAVYVGRPTIWGNPWQPRDAAGYFIPITDRVAWAVRMYRRELDHWGLLSDYSGISERGFDRLRALEMADMHALIRHELRGKDLACWCPLGVPCHADVLLEIANVPTPSEETDG